MTANNRISLGVPSRIDHLDLLQGVAERLARMAGLDEDATLDLALAVREACINAMKHAHQFDETRLVRVEFATQPDAVSVAVRDEGPGFDPAACPDPRDPENLLRTCGRGLFLIRSLVDEVRFRHLRGGMELVLVKRLAPS